MVATPGIAPTPAASPRLASTDLAPLEYSNPFDAQRRLWPDRVPPPPPAAPPPPPPPFTEQDLQLYGVAIVGADKRATVKVGGRLASLAEGGRSFATLTEGQPLGEYRVARIEPTHLVLQAATGSQQVYFTKKNDRSSSAMVAAASAPQPVQGAIEPVPAPAEAPAHAGAATAAQPGSPARPPAGQAGATAAAALAAGQPAAAAPAPVASPSGAPNSLAEALAAARDRALQQQGAQGGGQPVPALGNPFMNMMKP